MHRLTSHSATHRLTTDLSAMHRLAYHSATHRLASYHSGMRRLTYNSAMRRPTYHSTTHRLTSYHSTMHRLTSYWIKLRKKKTNKNRHHTAIRNKESARCDSSRTATVSNKNATCINISICIAFSERQRPSDPRQCFPHPPLTLAAVTHERTRMYLQVYNFIAEAPCRACVLRTVKTHGRKFMVQLSAI
jgi:hypothetical protein